MDTDSINRVAKTLIDDDVDTYDDALAELRRYTLDIVVGNDVASSLPLRTAVLTAVATGTRCCHGGVRVAGPSDGRFSHPSLGYSSLAEAVAALGGRCVDSRELSDGPLLVVGDCDPPSREVSLRVTIDGWRGGVVPLEFNTRLGERGNNTAAGVLAGALGVSEVFQVHRKRRPQAGHRPVGFSLWRPGVNWLHGDESEVPITALPSKYWLIGLGHLGQAYAWTIAQLPYGDPSAVSLVLQDYDRAVEGNESTGVLTAPHCVGRMKTRIVAEWLELHGFPRTAIVERKFGSNFALDLDEPTLALCGVDDDHVRTALEDVGFARVIEAGLGADAADVLKLRLHGFPSIRPARESFRSQSTTVGTAVADQRRHRPAYMKMQEESGDECGVDLIAGLAVGLPFVGVTAAALVVGEAVRTALGQHRHSVIDVDLGSAYEAQAVSFIDDEPPNVGLTPTLVNAGE